DVRQVAGGRAAGEVDVLDEGGAGRSAVALPQLPPVRAVVGREEQRPVHVRQVAEVGGGAAGADVLEHYGAGGGAVALPQLRPALEEQRPVPVRQVEGRRAVDVGGACDRHGGLT